MHVSIRFCTAIMLIAICAFSVARGFSFVRFSLAIKTVDLDENRAATIHAWTAVQGVASAALQSQLPKKVDPSDLKEANSRREALAEILSIQPLSSMDWLSLSGMQLMTDQPMEQVFGTLVLSVMTGPNEGYVMADRGIFEVSLWEVLSPDLKRRAAMDLTAEDIIRKNEKLRATLDAKPVGVRNEVRTAVLTTGLATKEVERRLGF
jgi:hypothetical protein